MKDTTSDKSVKPRPAPGPVPMPSWEWEWIGVGYPGGELRINDRCYDVRPIHNEKGVQVGWRLEREPTESNSDSVVYDIDITGGAEHLWTCDCADATYRQRECKHLKALKAALPKLAELQAQPRSLTVEDDDELDFSDLDELNEQLDQLERGSDLDELLAWAEQTLPCAPVPCVCTDTSDTGCLRCRVQRFVWTRKWAQEQAKPE